MIKTILVYLIAVNLIGFCQMYLDKQKAKKGSWRIPERNLWVVAILGGSLGSFIALRLFRHKTKHLQFAVGFPLLVVLQGFIIYKLLYL